MWKIESEYVLMWMCVRVRTRESLRYLCVYGGEREWERDFVCECQCFCVCVCDKMFVFFCLLGPSLQFVLKCVQWQRILSITTDTTESVTDLDYQIELPIFEPILTSFKLSIVFRGIWGNSVNWLKSKIEPPSIIANFSCPLCSKQLFVDQILQRV